MNKEELKQEAEQDAGNVSGLDLSTSLMVTKNKTDAYRLGRFDGYLSGAEPREKRISELEKENAELKGLKDVATLIRANNDTVVTLMQLNNKLVSKSQQLTKAKELLERLLITSCNSDVLNLLPNCSEVLRVRVETEQFLKGDK